MTVVEHVTAINRARKAFARLEQHPATTRAQLGAGRDLVNRIHNLDDTEQVQTWLHDLEVIVSGI